MAEITQALSELIEQERERFGVPGCAVVVVHEGEVVLAQGYGSRNLDEGLPVTTQTLFPIGSSTKTFTAAICALAVDQGLIGWDEPVAPHFAGFALKDPVASQQISLRDMLSHRSGLPRHDLLWYSASDGSLTRDDLVAVLRHLDPSAGFRERWQYNNLLYAAAGFLAGRLFGSSYEDAVRTHLLEPLGMKRSNFRVVETEQDADAATPYVVAPGATEAVRVPFADLDLISPAGAINSCAEEMTPWLLELLGRAAEPVLSPAALDRLRTPVIPLAEVSPLAIARSVGYAAGLSVDEYRGHRVLHHGGNIDGFSSQVSFIPEIGTGVVVLTNRSATGLRDALPYVLYDRLLGLEPQPHGATTWEKEESLRGMLPGRTSLVAARPELPAIREESAYVGRYAHPGYGTFEVTQDSDGLGARYRAVTARLVHQHLDVFDFHAELGGEEHHLPVQFAHGLTGDVVAVTAVMDQLAPPVRFERQPDPVDAELLSTLPGAYVLGPVTMTVAVQGDALTVSIAGGASKKVTPLGGNRFSADGIVVELRPPDTISTPYGDFVKAG